LHFGALSLFSNSNFITGYTQSGSFFHAKTRALEKILHKAFPPKPISPIFSTYPGGIQLFYPTAPLRLVPADIPGYTSTSDETENEETDAWGWWKRETGTGVYYGLEQGLSTIKQTIEDAGGIDGVIGFSQGGCAAAFVASLLEPSRASTFSKLRSQNSSAFSYPEGWAELAERNGELKFGVSYSGFYAPGEEYRGFYEPKIKTTFLSVIGSLDSVVEEERSKGLVERTVGERVVFHAGGHFVPVNKEMAGILVGFVKECCVVKEDKVDSVEDMDVPF
jgi:Serine hydrolase (FSH1)